MSKPIMTNLGLFTASCHAWLYGADGDFPFDDCDDRTTSPQKRAEVIAGFGRDKAAWHKRNNRRKRIGLTWEQYYKDPRE